MRDETRDATYNVSETEQIMQRFASIESETSAVTGMQNL